MLFAVACSGGPTNFSPQIAIEAAQDVAVASPPNPAKIDSPMDEILVGEVTFTHSGFRTQVTKALPLRAAFKRGSAATVELSLQNLSPPSGSIQARATINFGSAFENYLQLPTRAGPLRLYLHRDGTLRTESGRGGFT